MLKRKNFQLSTFNFQLLFVPLHPQNGKVLYGMLLVNPPGLDRSKGSRS